MSFITAAGVVGFSNQITRTAPNNVVPVSYFIATGVEANIDAAFGAKGQGAISAAIPDNTAAGGNKRGTKAVDWQLERGAGVDVAGAANSVIGGGFYNKINAASTYGVIAGGQSNSLSGGSNGFIGGGGLNVVDSGYGAVPYGLQGTTRGMQGAVANALGQRVALGDRQTMRAIMFRVTTDATPIGLSATGAGGQGATNTLPLLNNSGGSFTCYVSAKDITPGTDNAGFKIEGYVKRGANAAATAFVGVPVVTSLGADVGAAAWAVTMIADTTLGAIYPQVTGAAGISISWFSQTTLYSTG